ncbi:MAG: hypothetical protein R3E96_10290 [Planctomycetota bacterium]
MIPCSHRLSALLLIAPVLAQGDDCSSATPISGVGLFPFDITGMTDSGQGCWGLSDGFFVWTAPAAGEYLVEYAPPTAFDGTLASYYGSSCTLAQLADCNISPFAFGGVRLPSTQVGDTFVIQLGVYGGWPGPGSLKIDLSPCAQVAAAPDALEPNNTMAQAATLAMGTHTGLNIADGDPDWYSVTIPPQRFFRAELDYDQGWRKVQVFNPGGSLLQTSYDAVEIVNATPAPMPVFVKVETESLIWPDSHFCGPYSLILSDPTTLPAGAFVCPPMAFNSAGGYAELHGWYQPAAGGSGVILECEGGPPGEFGYFLVASQSSATGVFVGQGRLCLTGTIARFNVTGTVWNSLGQFDATGAFKT